MAKPWYLSKTVLLTVLGVGAMVAQIAVGEQLIPIEYQSTALMFAALALRFVTSEGVTLPSTSDVSSIAAEVLRLLRLRK
jgi:hypothetical protein